MNTIKVSDFGPIGMGFRENNGHMEFSKVSVLIGNQGVGKSTIAKLVSTFSWLEKVLFREELKLSEVTRKNKFENTYCAYQGLKNYFKENSYIEFKGLAYHFIYQNQRLTVEKAVTYNDYLVPKIMYVPAERNFLSAVAQPDKLKYLPQPLYTFLDEYERSQQELTESLALPINNLRFQYHKQNKTANIVGENYRIKLTEASSGLQSVVPLFLVSRNLALSINKESDASKKEISIEDEKKIRAVIEKVLLNSKISETVKESALELLSSKYRNSCFLNVVEEIEQNLFPKSQKEILYKLIEFVNYINLNQLILTTHSPYIINYLSVAIKAFSVLRRIRNNDNLVEKMTRIIPKESCINPVDVRIYELNNEGEIILLSDFEGIPSDNNYLNNFLAETNALFDGLLEIEEEIV